MTFRPRSFQRLIKRTLAYFSLKRTGKSLGYRTGTGGRRLGRTLPLPRALLSQFVMNAVSRGGGEVAELSGRRAGNQPPLPRPHGRRMQGARHPAPAARTPLVADHRRSADGDRASVRGSRNGDHTGAGERIRRRTSASRSRQRGHGFLLTVGQKPVLGPPSRDFPSAPSALAKPARGSPLARRTLRSLSLSQR